MDQRKTPSLKVNFFYNTSYQLLAIIIPLITTPYLSRVLGAKQIGTFSFSQSIANYFLMFALLGVANYGNRSIAAVRNDKEKLSKTFLSIYAFQAITSVISISVYIFFALLIADNRVLALIFLLYVVSAGFDINWFFFGLEKFKITTIRNAFVKIFTVISIFAFVKTPDDVNRYAFIYSIGILVSQIVMWGSVFRYIDIQKIGWSDIKQHIKPNIILFIPVIAVSLYKYMDKIMLGIMSNKTEVGYYESSDRMILVPSTIINSLGMVMLPRISNLVANNQRAATMTYLSKSIFFESVLASSLSFGIIAVGPVFVPWYYGPGFEKCITLFYILLPSCLFVGFANVIRTQYLIPNKKDKEYIFSVICGAIANLLLNWLLIRQYGSLGAAFATLIAEMAVCVIQSILVRHEIPIIRYVLISIPAIFAGIVMLLVLRLIDFDFISNSFVKLLIMAFIGALVFVSVIYLILTVNNKLKEGNKKL